MRRDQPPSPGSERLEAARTYRKSASTRAQSVLCVILLAGALFHLASTARALIPIGVAVLLLLMALFFAASAFGDRVTLTDTELRFDNRWLARCRPPRRLSLAAIESIREHRGRTLFLRDQAGRRYVIDAIHDYVDLRDRVLHAHRARRLPAAGP